MLVFLLIDYFEAVADKSLCVQLSLLQDEWRSRSLSSQMMTGAELAESSITDGFQHPRIRSEAAISISVL